MRSYLTKLAFLNIANNKFTGAIFSQLPYSVIYLDASNNLLGDRKVGCNRVLADVYVQ